MRTIIGALRLFVFLLSGPVTILTQSTVFLFTRGRFAYQYPYFYHAFCCRLLGIKIIVEGTPTAAPETVFIGNHVSYLDIPVLGSLIKGAFVAKKEVEDWPFFGLMGKMGQTFYISRNPAHAAREAKAFTERLDKGFPLILFPEGTSSDASKILPFKSSFFEIFLNRTTTLQPFTISILSVNGQPAENQQIRDLYAWHGDMTLLPHLWSFAKGKGAVIKVKFEESMISSSYTNRKVLSNDCYDQVVKGLDLSPAAPYGHSLETQ